MVFQDLLLGLHEEIIVDLFAGGGGASVGIERATGRQVDVAINHDPKAVAMHRVNHPQTTHYTCDVHEVCPYEAAGGRPIGILWASPDCTHHSRAKGGKPLREKDKRQRAISWVVPRWAGQVRPRIILMENVQEIEGWGPLVAKRDSDTGRCLKEVTWTGPGGEEKSRIEVAAPGERVPVEQQLLVRDKARAGERFAAWVRKMRACGYEIEWGTRKAKNYGAPTTRERFFVVARRDGKPCLWPARTHAEPESPAVRAGRKKPHRSAASIIDWDHPMASIFLSPEEATAWKERHGKSHPPRRPLAGNTMRRIARGFFKYVLEAEKPFVVPESDKQRLSFISTFHGGERRGDGRGSLLRAPLPTQDRQNRYAVVTAQVASSKDAKARALKRRFQQRRRVAAFLTQNNGGFYDGDGRSLQAPTSTITKSGSHRSLVAASLVKLRGTSTAADVTEPLHTISAGGNHHTLVAAHLMTNTSGHSGAALSAPLPTLTTGGHHALVASLLRKHCPEQDLAGHISQEGYIGVHIDGHLYIVEDLFMRMLQPRECYRANGFHDGHVISHGVGEEGERVKFAKYEKMGMCGNAVPPQFVEAFVGANAPELVARPELEGRFPKAVGDGADSPLPTL